jgi:cytochrome c oxidase cbb3-type subunit II
MTNFRSFVFKLLLCFAAPWLLLIVWPAIQYSSLKPVGYDKDKGDELDSNYSYPLSAANHQGAGVYASEGCVNCHSQMIRPAQVALDAWRKGWGSDQSDMPAVATRATTIRDYSGEQHAFLGLGRSGPDLANAGYRFPDRNKLHLMLYAPKSINNWSTMPSYAHLYEVRKSIGSGKALALKPDFAPGPGLEVVPTPAAEQLVDYILSLKRDYPKPGDLSVAAAAQPKK